MNFSESKTAKGTDLHMSKDEAENLFDMYGEISFNEFVENQEFPFSFYNDELLNNELRRLRTTMSSDKNPSKLIMHFHKSISLANRKDHLSPIDFWNKLKGDFDLYHKIYVNRMIYANTALANKSRETGILDKNVLLGAFSIMHLADKVSYLKPNLAKRLIHTYLQEFESIFNPFNGFSGIMLGAFGEDKSYIGQDINSTSIDEATNLKNFILKSYPTFSATLKCQDVFEDSGEYDCLICCPPYEDIEQWNFDENGNNTDKILNCDQWIDICLEHYKCKKYLFVVDDKIQKHKNNVVEALTNKSHFGSNIENVILIKS